jgi:hypothetical protein
VIDLLIDRQISSVIDELISSLLYTEINGLFNPENKRINTFLIKTVYGGNTTLFHKRIRYNSTQDRGLGENFA